MGVVTSPGRGQAIRTAARRYVERLGLADASVEVAQGHPIRFRRRGDRIAAGAVLLAGDAAGLADQFTAEGIGYAAHSGALAAAAVLGALASDGDAASRYTLAIDREIQPELDAARAISRLYYAGVTAWPGLAMAISARMNYFWRAFFRVMRGEASYRSELARWPGLNLAPRVL